MLVDLRAAFLFLTTLPLPYVTSPRPGRTFAYYPLVGLVIGACLWGAMSLNVFSLELRAWGVLLLWVVLTGGLHLDGFADSCDGLFAAVGTVRRLEIMKDSRAGSWAVVGVALLLLGKWAALREVPPDLLVLPPVMGRWGMVLAVYAFPYARREGIGAAFRVGMNRTGLIVATLTMLVPLILLAVWVNLFLLGVLPLTGAAVLVVGWWAARRLGGGLTGDLYGALCEVVELLTLLALSA